MIHLGHRTSNKFLILSPLSVLDNLYFLSLILRLSDLSNYLSWNNPKELDATILLKNFPQVWCPHNFSTEIDQLCSLAWIPLVLFPEGNLSYLLRKLDKFFYLSRKHHLIFFDFSLWLPISNNFSLFECFPYCSFIK